MIPLIPLDDHGHGLGPELTLVWRADSKQLFWVALEFLDFFLPLSLHLYTSTPLHTIYVYTY